MHLFFCLQQFLMLAPRGLKKKKISFCLVAKLLCLFTLNWTLKGGMKNKIQSRRRSAVYSNCCSFLIPAYIFILFWEICLYKYGASYQYVYVYCQTLAMRQSFFSFFPHKKFSLYIWIMRVCQSRAFGSFFFSHFSFLFNFIISSSRQSPIREPSAVTVAAATVAATAVVWMDSTRLEPPPPRQKRSTPQPVISNLDEARQMIARLTERNTAQGHLLQAWKHRLKQQVVQFSLFLCNLHFVFLFFFSRFTVAKTRCCTL